MFYLNGKSVSEPDYANTLSELKGRAGFDGFFETMACVSGQIPLLEFHVARLSRSVAALGLEQEVTKHFESDLAPLELPEAGVVKYQILFESEKKTIQRLMELRPPRAYPDAYWQEGVSVLISSGSLTIEPGHQGIKSIKRALYERATKEYSSGNCAEALMLNSKGEVLEGTKTNVFGIKGNCLITPELSAAGVSGVMRAFIVQLAARLGVSVRIETVKIEDLLDMDAVFVSNALIGLWPVRSLFLSEKCLKEWNVECGDKSHPLIIQLQNNMPKGFMHA